MPSQVGYPAVMTTTNEAHGKCGFGGSAVATLVEGDENLVFMGMKTCLDCHLNQPVKCRGGGHGGTPEPESDKYKHEGHRIVRESDDFICLTCGAHLKYKIVNDPYAIMKDADSESEKKGREELEKETGKKY